MNKLFKSDSGIILLYGLISLLCIGGSCFALFADTQFNYYPIVITGIAFVFGLAYLFFMLKVGNNQLKQSKKQEPSVASLMTMNFLRFFIVIAAVVVSILFIYFGPKEGEIEKRVYILVVINGLPLLIDIFLFYMRSRYSE